jgi:redox-regulated HSP33 family molecular chaperone
MGPSGSFKKAIAARGDAVILTVEATQLVQELMDRSGDFPPAMIHLGQACLGALLLQALTDTEEPEHYELQWSVDGPFGNLYTDSPGFGQVRGTIQKGKAEVDSLNSPLGNGILQVRRTLPNKDILSTGIVPSSGQVGLDIVEYLEKSEQRTCGIDVSVKLVWDEKRDPKNPFRVEHAVGYLLHALPQSTEEKTFDNLAKWDRTMKALGPVSTWALPEGPEAITNFMTDLLLMGAARNEVLNRKVTLYCSCSQERAARAVSLLSRSEREYLEKNDAGEKLDELSITCEYCGAVYKLPRVKA